MPGCDLVLNILGFLIRAKSSEIPVYNRKVRRVRFLRCGEHIKLVVIFIAYSQGSFQFIKNKHTASVLLFTRRVEPVLVVQL